MASRLELQMVLEDILGSRNVYYDPPESVHMRYPAIRYSLSTIRGKHANNAIYKSNVAYEIVVIDPDPDSEIYCRALELPMCSFNRSYVANNLHHYVCTLYW